MNRTKIEQFEGHLCEIMWRWWHKGSKVTGILNLIQNYYPLDRNPTMTASHPVFKTWFQQQQANADDSISRVDSSDNEDNTVDEQSQPTDEPCSSQQVEQNAEELGDREQHAHQPEAAPSGQLLECTTSRETATSTLFVSY